MAEFWRSHEEFVTRARFQNEAILEKGPYLRLKRALQLTLDQIEENFAMIDLVQSEHVQAWKDYIASNQTVSARKTLFAACGPVVVELIRRGFAKPGERVAAFKAAEGLTLEEQQELLPELVAMASWGHGLLNDAKKLIFKLPRAYVVANVEKAAEPILVKGEEEEYRKFLELYWELDKDLTLKLAKRAAGHDDEEICEVGREYLIKCGQQ